MQSTELIKSPARISSFLSAANSTRAVPMAAANIHGPRRSATCLLTPSSVSAKKLAHWLIDCSAAPAQSMRSMKTHKILTVNSLPSGSGSSWLLSFSWAIGTKMQNTKLTSGRIAHRQQMTLQFPTPNILKNSVVTTTISTCPQQ